MSDAAARERALPCERMFPGTWADLGRTDCPVHDTLADALAAEQERIRRLEEALREARVRLRVNAIAWHTEKHDRRVDFENCGISACTNDQAALALIDAALDSAEADG